MFCSVLFFYFIILNFILFNVLFYPLLYFFFLFYSVILFLFCSVSPFFVLFSSVLLFTLLHCSVLLIFFPLLFFSFLIISLFFFFHSVVSFLFVLSEFFYRISLQLKFDVLLLQGLAELQESHYFNSNIFIIFFNAKSVWGWGAELGSLSAKEPSSGLRIPEQNASVMVHRMCLCVSAVM